MDSVGNDFAYIIQWMFGAGWLNDRVKMRGPTLVAQALIIITGASVMAFASNPGARYFGVFLAVGGTNSKRSPGPNSGYDLILKATFRPFMATSITISVSSQSQCYVRC